MGRLHCAMRSSLKANSGSLELAFLLCLAGARSVASAGCWNCKNGKIRCHRPDSSVACFRRTNPLSPLATPHTALRAQKPGTR